MVPKPNRIAIFMLTSVTAILALVFLRIAWLVPHLYYSVFGVRRPSAAVLTDRPNGDRVN